ncbi:MAG TPA: 16S rRNA (adenine(1518)-N(6)/adenine(1519)-N(6))-dimethyltransferase RsmA [Pyrinomonadaceae bacterium]|nr:16S rRNA (adenine(1518)-N(6)/adenine(1519)-N(6))-dimethyltransferase RsmA [Pyrinomonadaceae bacterium]
MVRRSRSQAIRDSHDLLKGHDPIPRPKRSLGQNFLVDAQVIDRIVDAVAPKETDTIVEIGPGQGALTERLVASGATVIAVELDRVLSSRLEVKFSNVGNFSVVEGDALSTDFAELLVNSSSASDSTQANAKLAANLPYNISTPILQRLIEQRATFSELVLMFQKEVADRITAEPGNRERGFLSVLVQSAFEVTKHFDVPPRAFRPVPRVNSSVVRLIPRPPFVENQDGFRTFVSMGFSQKRKTLLNNLRHRSPFAAEALKAASIDPARRAETLPIADWIELYRNWRMLDPST